MNTITDCTNILLPWLGFRLQYLLQPYIAEFDAALVDELKNKITLGSAIQQTATQLGIQCKSLFIKKIHTNNIFGLQTYLSTILSLRKICPLPYSSIWTKCDRAHCI